MKEFYSHKLKNGESIIFKTNMPLEEIQNLPILANQYKFSSYFQSRGYSLEIELIKKIPGFNKN